MITDLEQTGTRREDVRTEGVSRSAPAHRLRGRRHLWV